MNKKQVLAGILGLSMSFGLLSGCSSNEKVVTRDATKLELVSPLTQQDVLNYYAEALNYDTVITRDAKPHINTYVEREVTDEATIHLVLNTLSRTERYLSEANYDATEETKVFLNDNMYHYMRATLNDKKLTDGKDPTITQALGYYFVTKEYTIRPANIGTFKNEISITGMNGSMYRLDEYDKDRFDESYLMAAVKKMNEYYEHNKINKVARYNQYEHRFYIENSDGTSSYVAPSVPEYNEPVVDEFTAEGEVAQEPAPEPTRAEATKVISGEKTYVPRQNGIDLKLFNTIVGGGKHISYIPDLDVIYNKPTNSGGIAGIGIYPCGGLGLSTFGLNRENLDGTCTLVYVYKEDLVNPSKLSLTNIYIKYYDINTGVSITNDPLIPEFLTEKFNVLIDRADRAMVNCDVTGLVNGHIFNDVGTGVLTGYLNNNGNLLRQLSTVRRVMARDIKNNAYLVEIETFRQEGSKDADVYASYKDTVNVTIEQQDSEFVITDWMITNRQLVTQPDIDPDSAVAKRIVALGLSGEISDETKGQVTELLNDLYTASTNRMLYGPYKDANGTEHARGMYDCFNPNVEMLSNSKKEAFNANLRSVLVKYGVNTGATMYGQVTSWIGGSSNQVELTTEELVTYQGRSTGTYMTCYYLISCLEDTWVIDEVKVLTSEEVTDGLQTILSRMQ